MNKELISKALFALRTACWSDSGTAAHARKCIDELDAIVLDAIVLEPSLSCGQLYDAIRKQALANTASDYGLGFMHGLAEKVYLGACRAAMVRPTAHWNEHFRFARTVAEIYSLTFHRYEDEIWLTTPYSVPEFVTMTKMQKDSPEYHKLRAYLCGISVVDELYHLRYTAKEQYTAK